MKNCDVTFQNWADEVVRLRGEGRLKRAAETGKRPKNVPNERPTDMGMINKILSRCSISESGCIEFNGARCSSGYGSMLIGKSIASHRLMFLAVFGSIGFGMQICHHCDNPPCCNPNHLFEGTGKDNGQDCKRKGRLNRPRGIHAGASKLTEDAVRDIRKTVLDNQGPTKTKPGTIKRLVEKYGVTPRVIWLAYKNITYQNVA